MNSGKIAVVMAHVALVAASFAAGTAWQGRLDRAAVSRAEAKVPVNLWDSVPGTTWRAHIMHNDGITWIHYTNYPTSPGPGWEFVGGERPAPVAGLRLVATESAAATNGGKAVAK